MPFALGILQTNLPLSLGLRPYADRRRLCVLLLLVNVGGSDDEVDKTSAPLGKYQFPPTWLFLQQPVLFVKQHMLMSSCSSTLM